MQVKGTIITGFAVWTSRVGENRMLLPNKKPRLNGKEDASESLKISENLPELYLFIYLLTLMFIKFCSLISLHFKNPGALVPDLEFPSSNLGPRNAQQWAVFHSGAGGPACAGGNSPSNCRPLRLPVFNSELQGQASLTAYLPHMSVQRKGNWYKFKTMMG